MNIKQVPGISCLLASVMVIVFVLLTACSFEQESLMRIGTNVWPGYEPLYLSRDLGQLKKNRYHLVEYSNSSQTIASFRNGTIDAAALTLDEVLLLLQDGFNPRVVLIMDISVGGDVVIAKPEIESVEELKGMRVGVEDTALGAFMLTRTLEHADMSPADVEIVSLTVDQHERALNDAQVEAVVTFEPVRTRLLSAGNRLLFDSSKIPGEIVDVLVVRDEFLKNNREQVSKLLRHWFDALDYLERHPIKAAQHMAKRQRISPEEVLQSYEGLKLPDLAENRRLLGTTGVTPELAPSAARLADVMYQQALLKKPVDVESLFHNALPTDK